METHENPADLNQGIWAENKSNFGLAILHYKPFGPLLGQKKWEKFRPEMMNLTLDFDGLQLLIQFLPKQL